MLGSLDVDKTTPVMAYTNNMLVRGEVVTKENVRVSIWLRTDGAPRYLLIHKAQIVLLGGATPKMMSYPQLYVPVDRCLAFHMLPPAEEALDYDPNEKNRVNMPLELMVGSFLFKCKLRMSTQADLFSTLDVSKAPWMSVYDLSVSNPYLPQLSLSVPMALIRPNDVNFGVHPS
jgi:hypothetical protein